MENTLILKAENDFKLPYVVAVCFLAALLGGFYLYRDLTDQGGTSTGTPMAKITRFDTNVRRKKSSSYVWSPLKAGDSLYKKEYLQTGKGDTALITFENGATLEMKENSLVIVDNVSDISLNFVQGVGIVRDEKGTSRIKSDETGKKSLEAIEVKLLKPEPVQEFVTDASNEKISFVWDNGSKVIDGLSFQVSAHPGFLDHQVQSYPLKKSENTRVQSLKPGQYYWRIVKGKEVLSDVARFSITAISAPKPLIPDEKQKTQTWSDATPISFRFLTSQTDSKFLNTIEISKNSDFSKVIKSQDILAESGSVQLSGLPEGKLFWRIKAKYKSTEVTSSIQPFETVRLEKFKLPLLSPTEDSALSPKSEVRFSWDSPFTGGDLNYELEVVDDDGKKIISEKNLIKNYFVWEKPISGVFKFKVTVSSQQKVVGESAKRIFSVYKGDALALKAPIDNSKIYFWDTPTGIDFQWEKDPLIERSGNRYRIVVARDSNFKEKLIESLAEKEKKTDLKLDAKSPHLFWKVDMVDAKGQVLKSSQVRQFYYSTYPPLPAPTVGKLEDGIDLFNPAEKERGPRFSWDEVKDAKRYEILIYQKGRDSTAPTFALESNRSQISIEEIHEGEYRWSVRAIDRLNRKGEFMEYKNFKISYGDLPSAPKPLNDVVQ